MYSTSIVSMYITKELFLTRCIALWVILALMVTLMPIAPYAVGQEEKKPDGGGTTDTQQEAPPERVSDDEETGEETPEEREEEAGGDDEEEAPEPTAEPAPEQPQPQTQQQQQVQLPDDDDTADTQAQTPPTGALTLDLKAGSDSGSNTADNITKNTSLTFTISSSTSFGGTNTADDGTNIAIIYKNSSCSTGAAIPANGTAWGDYGGSYNGFHSSLNSAWRNTISRKNTRHPAASHDLSLDITAIPWGGGSFTAPTVTDGVKCFITAYFPDGAASASYTSSNTSTGLEVTIDRVTTTPTLRIHSGGGTASPTVRVANLENNSRVRLYTSSNCTTGALGSGDTTVGPTAVVDIALSGRTSGEKYYAKHTDVAGNTPTCSSAVTNTASAPPAPTGLTGAWTAGGVTLNWTDPNNSGITKYQYQQCNSAGASCGSWTDVASSGATTVTHPITGLTANTGYTFKLRAVNATGDGAAASTAGKTGTVYDTDTDGLIDINTIQKLNAIRWDLNGDGTPDSGHATNYNGVFSNAATNLGCPGPCTGYELTADLDFNTGDAVRTDDTYHNSGAGWEPIGADNSSGRFTAIFNGRGFVIDNLLINRSSTGTQALFAATDNGARITAVGLRDVNVTGANGSAALVGASQSGTVINASFSTGSITGKWATGGLVGWNAGTVEASYSSAAVSGTTAVGGLVGNSQNSGASIKNSYAYGAVTQSGSQHLGGLVGHSHSSATITSSYWNTEVTTAAGTGTTGAVGKTTTQLQTPTTYTGIYATWDDSDIGGTSANDAPWDFGTNSQYPALSFGGHRTATQRSAFTLDITSNGTANYLDAIVHYYYAQNPIDQSAGGAVMANFINTNDSPTKTGDPTTTAAIYTTMQDSATTRDFTGNGTTNYLDAIVHYYYAQNPIDQSAGGAVMANFINANDSPAKSGAPTDTAAIYTLLQNLEP